VILGATVVALGTGCGVARIWQPTREEVLQRILPSSVQIVLEQQEGRRFRTGSGVVIAARGADCFVLTSGHTLSGVAGQREVFVMFGRHEGNGAKARATVVAHRDNDQLDLALLRASSDRCVPAQPSDAAILGESVWVVAFPWGRSMTLASGVVSQVRFEDGPDPDGAARLMVDASVSYGSSGGGVYGARSGALIGVVEGYRTARITPHGGSAPWYIDVPVPGQTFVTSLTDIRRFLAESGHAGLIGGLDGSSSHRPVDVGQRAGIGP
jgi:S1-C subfamily serine protease